MAGRSSSSEEAAAFEAEGGTAQHLAVNTTAVPNGVDCAPGVYKVSIQATVAGASGQSPGFAVTGSVTGTASPFIEFDQQGNSWPTTRTFLNIERAIELTQSERLILHYNGRTNNASSDIEDVRMSITKIMSR